MVVVQQNPAVVVIGKAYWISGCELRIAHTPVPVVRHRHEDPNQSRKAMNVSPICPELKDPISP